jgi:hypothetical protein
MTGTVRSAFFVLLLSLGGCSAGFVITRARAFLRVVMAVALMSAIGGISSVYAQPKGADDESREPGFVEDRTRSHETWNQPIRNFEKDDKPRSEPAGQDMETIRKNLRNAINTRSNLRQSRSSGSKTNRLPDTSGDGPSLRDKAKAAADFPTPHSLDEAPSHSASPKAGKAGALDEAWDGEPGSPIEAKRGDFNKFMDEMEDFRRDPENVPDPRGHCYAYSSSGSMSECENQPKVYEVSTDCAPCASNVKDVNDLRKQLWHLATQTWIDLEVLDEEKVKYIKAKKDKNERSAADYKHVVDSLQKGLERMDEMAKVLEPLLEEAERALKECEEQCKKKPKLPIVETIIEDKSVTEEITDYDCSVKPYTGPTKYPEAQQLLIDNYNAHCLQSNLRQAINSRQSLDQERKNTRQAREGAFIPNDEPSLHEKAKSKTQQRMHAAEATKPKAKTMAPPSHSSSGSMSSSPTPATDQGGTSESEPAPLPTFVPPPVETVYEEYNCNANTGECVKISP